jgi:4-amino-4-deoxy-L-arabinose transferase-like glycosyltransferase
MMSDAFEKLAETLARSPRASLAAVVIAAFTCFLPGFLVLPIIDGEEPGYVVAAQEMNATGDFASVRLQTANGAWRARGEYWIAAFASSFGGRAAPLWVYRLPTLLAAVAAAAATWWLALALVPPRAALLAGLFVAGSGLVGLEARLATPDALLLLAVTLSAGGLARIWAQYDRRHRDIWAAVFWTGLAMGILASGFTAPAIVGVAVLLLVLERGHARWLARLRPGAGLAWTFVLVSPWLIATSLSLLQEGAASGPSGQFLEQIGVPFAISAPPGIYTLLLPVLVGPAVTYLFISFGWFTTGFRRPPVFVALAWGAPLWLFAELSVAKQPSLVLPAIPFVALVAATAIDAGEARIRGRVSWFYSFGPALWPPLTAILVPLGFYAIEHRFPWPAFIAFLCGAVLGPVTWIWLRRGQVVASAFLALVTVAFIYMGFFGLILPDITAIRVSEGVAAAAAVNTPCTSPVFAATGYPEESLVFALGPQTRLVDAWSAANFLNSAGCRVAVVERRQIPSFRQRAEDLGLAVRDRAHVVGVNMRKLTAVDLHLFTAASAAND